MTVNDLEFDEYSSVQNLFLSDRGLVRSELVKCTRSILSQDYTLCLGMLQSVTAVLAVGRQDLQGFPPTSGTGFFVALH